MNFKNPFLKQTEFQKSQAEFTKKIRTSKHNVGIEDELINMRGLIYISEGEEGVKKFDERLLNSFEHYQEFLMGNKQMYFGHTHE